MARGLLEGVSPQLFFQSNMGEEPLAVYLVAAALGLFGQQAWIIRLPSAVAGALTVPLAWWLGRELLNRPRCDPCGQPRGYDASHSDLVNLGSGGHQPSRPMEANCSRAQSVGVATALALGVLYWHVSFSRIGMEPILVPFTATLAFAALLRGLNTGRWLAYVVAGVAFGASLYTYKAGYFVPVVGALFVGYSAIKEPRFLRRHSRGLLLSGFVVLIVVAPLGFYFVTHPDDFVHRPASVSLLGGDINLEQPWLAMGENILRVLGMFFVQGDTNPRSNLPGRPALDPFLALLLLAGLGTALARFNRPRWALPIIWLIVMIVPTIVTEYAPHFARAIGAVPALALLCGIGVSTLLRAAVGRTRPWLKWGVLLFLAFGFVFSTVSTVRAYFHSWKNSPGLFYTYDVGLTHIADYINVLPVREDVYLTPTDREHYTLQYLVHRPFGSFDGRHGLVLPPPGQGGTIIVLLREDEVTLANLKQVRPDGNIAWTLADARGRPYALAYGLPATATPGPTLEFDGRTRNATFGGAARLLGFSLDSERVAPGDRVDLTLFWEALAPLDQDYTVFAHLLGDFNPATQGPVWAGHDSQPVGGHYPTTSWKPGETVLDVHQLAIPEDAPPGVYQLEVGLYLLATMSRLPAVDGAGEPLPEGAALLGAIEVGGSVHEP